MNFKYLLASALLGGLASLTLIRSALGAGGLFALVGLAGGMNGDLSAWNWYNQPVDFTLAMMVDQVVCFFVAGVAVGWAQGRFARA